MDRGEYADAIELLEASAEASPHFKTLELLGECRLKNGDAHGAILPLAASIGLGRNESRACYLLATAYMAIDEHEEALRHVRRALLKNPNYETAKPLLKLLEDHRALTRREPTQLAEEFLDLIPWIERWAFGDDDADERALMFEERGDAAVREFVNVVTPRIGEIRQHLASFSQPWPEPAFWLMALVEAAIAADRFLASRAAG
jgi:tetratricopeptide (TPR) repeat protein